MSTDKKKDFHETLAELVEYATVNGNQLTPETIHEYFQDLITEESQYEFLYDYLTSAKIKIEGYTPSKKETADKTDAKEAPSIDNLPEKAARETEEALTFYRMYLDDLNALTPGDAKKNEALLKNFLSGDADSTNQLAENYLPMVLKVADTLANHGLSHSELVAEGNLALYESILGFSDPQATLSSFESYLFSSIEKALLSAINEEIGSNRISDHLTEQVNALNDASTELAKELNCEATLEELCERLSLSEDEVKELMKVSINALTVVQTEE